MIARGEDRTDWARVNATSEAELEASILADPDDVHEGLDWTKAVQGIPLGKEHINLRVDHDVMQWFRSNGKGYEALMNNVLRDYVESKRFAS
jgi:uncharacterized protein (DUF4415 family)